MTAPGASRRPPRKHQLDRPRPKLVIGDVRPAGVGAAASRRLHRARLTGDSPATRLIAVPYVIYWLAPLRMQDRFRRPSAPPGGADALVVASARRESAANVETPMEAAGA